MEGKDDKEGEYEDDAQREKDGENPQDDGNPQNGNELTIVARKWESAPDTVVGISGMRAGTGVEIHWDDGVRVRRGAFPREV